MAQLSFRKRFKDIVREQPVYAGVLLAVLIAVIYFMLSGLELLPENEREGRVGVLEKGENVVWLGMEVAPLSRNIRKEFSIPRRVRGIFIVDEGKGMAKAEGIKTGDVIRAINRRHVYNRRSLIKTARHVKYYDGILLDIYRDGKNLYVTVPYEYEYGPLLGPNKGHWQLGSPVWGQALPYGKIIGR